MWHDYCMRYKKGEIDSYNKYLHLLEESGAHRLLHEAMMRNEDFEKMTDCIDEFLESRQE